jgi:hypothetical protein
MSNFTKRQENLIISKYQSGLSTCKLEKEFKCSDWRILDVLKEYNIPRRSRREINKKYIVKSNYFSQINSHEKAYILGLLMTDGYNRESHGYVHFGLQESDKYIVEYVNSCLHINNRPVYLKKQIKGYKKHFYTFITDKQISKDLAKLGCVQKKSLILRFSPNLPRKYINSYILGCFDGDGCIFLKKTKRRTQRQFYICSGSVKFCQDIQEKIKEQLGILGKIRTRTNTKTKNLISYMTFTKINDLLILKNWLYKNQEIYLKRKKEIFDRL